jgi:RNA-directed DNA polymerase
VDIRPARQVRLPLEGDVSVSGTEPNSPVERQQLMELVLERENMKTALRKVEQNGGAPGADGMRVEELREYLVYYWPSIREQLLAGEYKPQPVRGVEIPKPKGGSRKLGIPTVLDRLIQQALLQVLQEEWDETFSEESYGFRPGRNAHQAVAQAQKHIKLGYRWVVDMDLEKFFDRVNHDKLMGEVSKRIKDRRVKQLIRRYLEAGAVEKGVLHETTEGTPQGGPLSPLLANLLLDRLDAELKKRGHRFVRYADDCNVYVRSLRAGKRVKSGITKYLRERLKLKVNESKSAVDRPWNRRFLGFTITKGLNRSVSVEAVKKMKARIREITGRTRGRSIKAIVKELSRYIKGWRAYFKEAEVKSVFRELDSWIRRRLRCYMWKQWGQRGYRELVRRGVSRDLAWNTAKSAHGPWRLSHSPALLFALGAKYFTALGLPRLFVRTT